MDESFLQILGTLMDLILRRASSGRTDEQRKLEEAIELYQVKINDFPSEKMTQEDQEARIAMNSWRDSSLRFDHAQVEAIHKILSYNSDN